MFDKFHLTFNFKSKVSRVDFKNKNECQLTYTFYSKILAQFWVIQYLEKQIFWIIKIKSWFVTKKLLTEYKYPLVSHVSPNVEDGIPIHCIHFKPTKRNMQRTSRIFKFNLWHNFLNFKSSVLGIDHTKVSITDVGGVTCENGLSTTSLEYVMSFRDLWMLMAFKSQSQQWHSICFQPSFNSGIVNCTLYIKLNLKGIFALCKVYLKSWQCQAETP